MKLKISPRLTLLALGLALLLTSLAACRKESPDADKTAVTPGATPAQPGGTPSPGQSAAPGQAAAPAGQPGDNNPLPAEKIPAVVAKVNGVEIKKDDLVQGAQRVRAQLARMGRPVPLTTGFYRQVLHEMIGLALLQEEAKQQGVTATEAEVQQQLAALKGSLPSEEAYKKNLQASGLTEDMLRQQIGDRIAVQKYVQNQVAANVNVNEQITREFYEKNKDQMRSPERVHVRHILVRPASAADKAKAREKAEGLLKQLQDGADFAKLAQENSEDPGSKGNGGDLGWVARGQTVPSFEQAAFALTKPNELSPVVESQFGYHIIQFVEREKPAPLPYEQVKDRLGPIVRQQRVTEMVQQRIQQLRSKGKIEIFI